MYILKGKLKELVQSTQTFIVEIPSRVKKGGGYQPLQPFQCNTCPKAFKTWGDLVRHCIRAKHIGEGCHPV